MHMNVYIQYLYESIHIFIHVKICVRDHGAMKKKKSSIYIGMMHRCVSRIMGKWIRHDTSFVFFNGYCSTVQGLLDWFEVDLGFTELSISLSSISLICKSDCGVLIFFIFYFFDGYCSTVQGLLDWFEVDLGFTELSFIQNIVNMNKVGNIVNMNEVGVEWGW